MLTVLIKHQATGRDVLFEAESVEYGADQFIMNAASGMQTILDAAPVSDPREVFVMNTNGKTVARYQL